LEVFIAALQDFSIEQFFVSWQRLAEVAGGWLEATVDSLKLLMSVH